MIKKEKKQENSIWDIMSGFLAFFVVLGFMAVVSWILFSIISAIANKPCEQPIVDTRIYSLILSKDIQGSFFLGVGGFGSAEKYYAFEERQGGKLLQTYSAERTVIIESNETPVYRTYPIALNCPGKLDELVVPPGTVKVQYNVDINN